MVIRSADKGRVQPGSGFVIPQWIPVTFVLILCLKLFSILPKTLFATEVQYPLVKIYLFTFYEDLSLLAMVLFLWLLLTKIRFLGHLIAAGILGLYLADTLLIRALFNRLTILQLYRYADELPAVRTFLFWWHVPILVAAILLVWLIRKKKIRLRIGRAAVVLLMALIAALPWLLSGAYLWDPYIDFTFCNVLRINSRVVLNPGISTENYELAASEFPDLARKVALELSDRIPLASEHNDPAARKLNSNPNIILVLSESLSRIDSKRSGGIYNRLPRIDQMSAHGVTLTEVIANGNNTSEALVSLLTGEEPYPTGLTEDALMDRFPPSSCDQGADNLICHARKNGYRTLFISNAPLIFQQNRLWLKRIGFDRVEGGESKYFRNLPKGSFGAAPDRYLFDRALSVIKRQKRPFFMVLMTISLHRPFLVPIHAERISRIDFYNLLHYVDKTTFEFWQALNRSGFFSNGRMILVGDHRRMTPLEPLELQENGVDSLGRVFGCIVGKGIPANTFVRTPLNLNDIMNILWATLSGLEIDYSDLEPYNKGVILGMGFPFTTHLFNLDLAQVQVRIPGRKPQFVTVNQRMSVRGFGDDPEMRKVAAYMILKTGRLAERQREENETAERVK